MIFIKNLVVDYNKKKHVINKLNITITDNTINGIVGLNGSGKTTLLNTMYGLKRSNSGEILNQDVKLSKKQMSYLPAENFFYSNITAREYLNLFKNSTIKIDEWNQLFLLPLEQLIDFYSTGMKKKLAIFGLLMQNKQLLILDEPFNGLDIETVRILRSLLLKLKETGKTIIITSHILETLTNVCDEIHFLENGKIKFSKAKEDFKSFETNLFQLIENKNEKLINELGSKFNSFL